ncbi:MAG: glycosyltransferase family 9 protein [Synergistaceae bacterium]|jgi:ADP-heptose:LPS heptosyltransferase|nr:glycosyltransferase family 9 protein [Synergistaceae bacterium]
MNEKNTQEKFALPQPGDKVLWIRFLTFGDVLEAAADAYNFKRRFPQARLTFLTNPEYLDFFRAQPHIDETLVGRKSPLAEWWRTFHKIRGGDYKWVVSGQWGGKTALLARFSRALYRIGESSLFFKHNYHMGLSAWAHACGFDAAARDLPSVFVPEEDLTVARALMSHLPERRLFVLLGAGKEKKMWPTNRWIGFLRPLADEGWGIVLNGHDLAEEAIGRQIEKAVASSNLLNLVGRLDFKKMAGAALCCRAAVGNDTGPLHLAALCGVPTLGLFSHPTSRLMGLRMPWFQELCAENWSKSKIPLKDLPVEPVAKAFKEMLGQLTEGVRPAHSTTT